MSSWPLKDYPSFSDGGSIPLQEMGMRLLLSSIISVDLEQKSPQWRLMNWILDVWVGAFLPLGIQGLRAGKKLKCIPRSVHAPGDGSCRPSTKFIETSVLEARLASSICSAPLPPSFSL